VPRADIGIAALLAAAGVIEGLIGTTSTGPLVSALGGAASAIPLAWRRTHPASVAVAVGIPVTVAALFGLRLDDNFLPLIVWVGAIYSMSLHAPSRAFVAGIAGVLTVGAVAVMASGESPADILYFGFIVLIASGPGRLLRHRLVQVARLTERAVRAELDLEERARSAALEERDRLARELHDIIGHSVSLMVVHAAAAEARLSERDIARNSLAAVQEVGRQAVTDLARLLGVLREDHQGTGLAPQPGIADLQPLIESAQQAGDKVSLITEGDGSGLPPAIGLSVYRIVQEALTNARRHAPGAPVSALVRFGDRSVVVEVVNSQTLEAQTAAPQTGNGQGLVGLRERIAMFNGTLRCGQEPDGGFAVRAELPLGGSGA